MSSDVDIDAHWVVGQNLPFVSIVMPTLNEEHYISAAIESLLPSSGRLRYELLVVDGGSSDRTRSIVEGLAASNRSIRLLANDRRIQAVAVNIGAKAADPRAKFLVRADCHLKYPADFVERCINRLVEMRVASVVVPMRTEGTTCMQRAIAAAQNSRLGNGGAAHRLPGRSGFVDHGHHAAFDRAVFLELGGYNESFSHNEDAEFDKRLVGSGRQIYLDGETVVTYHPRSDLRRLARQYFGYGWGRAGTARLHGGVPRVRQILPVFAVVGSVLVGLAALVEPLFLALPAAYAAACVACGVFWAARDRQPCLAFAGIAAVAMHMSWGCGFIARWVRDLKLSWAQGQDRSSIVGIGKYESKATRSAP